MDKDAWAERELAKRPERSREWKAETFRLWMLGPAMTEREMISRGPVSCPECGQQVDGTWTTDEPEDQECPSCGNVFQAEWPGFTFEPRTVIVERPPEEELSDPKVLADSVSDAQLEPGLLFCRE